jgi:hypothetical protein
VAEAEAGRAAQGDASGIDPILARRRDVLKTHEFRGDVTAIVDAACCSTSAAAARRSEPSFDF